jgi:hypothetical protein
MVYPEHATAQDYLWRLSVADIIEPGDFSVLPQIDRILVLLKGAGLQLQLAKANCVLANCLQAVSFKGETLVRGQPADLPARVLNLMTRRGSAAAVLNVWQGTFTGLAEPYTRVWFVADGSYQYRDADGDVVTLDSGDAMFTHGEQISFIANSADAAIVEAGFKY